MAANYNTMNNPFGLNMNQPQQGPGEAGSAPFGGQNSGYNLLGQQMGPPPVYDAVQTHPYGGFGGGIGDWFLQGFNLLGQQIGPTQEEVYAPGAPSGPPLGPNGEPIMEPWQQAPPSGPPPGYGWPGDDGAWYNVLGQQYNPNNINPGNSPDYNEQTASAANHIINNSPVGGQSGNSGITNPFFGRWLSEQPNLGFQYTGPESSFMDGLMKLLGH